MVVRARECVARLETSVCRQEIAIIRLLMAGRDTASVEVALATMNTTLGEFLS